MDTSVGDKYAFPSVKIFKWLWGSEISFADEWLDLILGLEPL